ncbi:hypothetical protein VIGAN_06012800 [Vigna angularis var. angularis]|uniref:Dehydrin n=1 Tax=Vigna angularis var. angularis TaxID=157739 RepID=A0A0S3S8W6_PHAAN|nr:uncharacterized protein LOC108339089 [Vigna angularis]BAT89229.1 hypothetical protein VIGAN_06012800 [Vigna angularis var. angularis]
MRKGNPVHLTGVATIAYHTFFEDKGFEDNRFEDSRFEDEGHVKKKDRTKEKFVPEKGEGEMKENLHSKTSLKEKLLEEEKEKEKKEHSDMKTLPEEKEEEKTCRISNGNIDEHRSTIKGIIEIIKERLPGQGNH